MSWKSLEGFPLKSPFYPEILPVQKYSGAVTVRNSTTMSASQNTVVTLNVPAIPAGNYIIYYQLSSYTEENYTPADARVGGCLLVNGGTQFQYTIKTSANIVGTHRVYVVFTAFYETI